MHISHVAEEDNGAVDLLHRQVVDLFEHDRARIERYVPVELPHLLVAGRQDEVLHRDGVDDIVSRDVVGLHGLLIEIDLHLQNFAAIGRRHCGAGDRRELWPDEILAEIKQLHLRQLFARQRQLENRHAGSIVAQHIRRCDTRRQQLKHGLRGRRHLRQGSGNIDVFLEKDFNHAVAIERLRLDVLDVAYLGGQVAFVKINHATRHVVRQESRVRPYDADDRNIDVGKDVDRRSQRRQRSKDRDHK